MFIVFVVECTFGKDWAGRHAISISGCLDNETSGDTGGGGIFTHSLLLAVAKLSRVAHDDYSVGALYNATLKESQDVFKAKQDIAIQAAPSFAPDMMAWPLVPAPGYMAPLHEDERDTYKLLLGSANADALNGPVVVEEYIQQVMGGDFAGPSFNQCAGRSGRVCAGPECSVQ